MTAPATPRTDALHFDWKDGIDMQRHELLKLSRALERELAAIHEEAKTNPKWAFLEWRKRAEEAEAKNAELLAALEEIKGRVQFGVSTHMGSDIVKMCDAALKGKA